MRGLPEMQARIGGRTRIIALLGVPTETFKSPLIYNPWFRNRGIDCIVVPMGCEAADFRAFLPLVFRLRNIAGALVTMPHKVAAAGLLDEAGLAVDICGSCNAVKRDGNDRLVGDMFDGEGFVAGIRGKGREVRGTSALVVGSGGVGSAIAASLAQAGARRLALFDIDGDACDRLAVRLRTHYPDLVLETGSNDPQGHDIVVNATPVGMKPDDSLPMDAERIMPGSFVGDVVLAQEETPFLAAARARGCLTQAGIDMVFEQVPACLEFFGFPTAAPEELRRLAELED